jgi:uncharacterized repeat protein (TIGR03803 family)
LPKLTADSASAKGPKIVCPFLRLADIYIKELMKKKPPGPEGIMLSFLPSTIVRIWLWRGLLTGLLATSAQAADRQVLHNHVPAAVTNAEPVRHMSRWTKLNLTIGLPLRDRPGLTNLLQQLYDPASANFHHYLTPDQFAQRFAPTEEDYQSVVNFAQSHGLHVTGKHSNRTLVSVRGMAGDVERAFHITLNEYQHPTEARTFYAPSADPSVDLATPLLSVGGLDNFVVPRRCLHPMAVEQAKPDQTGAGPGGTYVGNDFRAAYVPGETLTGTGQTVGLLEFESGYFQNDITSYETLAGLPNVPVTPVLLDGYGGGPGNGNDEVSLDIEMAISMAPGLNGVVVYEGSTTDDILNRMATDDLAKQIGASWTYGIDATSEQIFMQFGAQGQSFFNASGDSDAYTGVIPTPADDPNITVVGGTTLTTTGPGGAWVSETVWNWGSGEGGSGGISTVYPIPTWQQGISMASNQGSTTMRNLPDVAMTADNVYVIYGNGQAGSFGGTSCATPLWAAFTALMNELALTNDEPAVGFINPAVYAIGKGSNSLGYTTLFHDITTGNDESPTSPNQFFAVPGYDLCTGWGTPSGNDLIMAIALPEPLRITPLTGLLFTGKVAGPFGPASQTCTLTNNGPTALNWSLANTSAWFTVSPNAGTLVQGGPAATVSASVAPAAASLPAGSYSAALQFTDLGNNYVQNRQITLAVVTPPVITAQPANQALLDGMTANFSVQTGPNALMYYQWQENGTNLTDGGLITGSATSNLTISNVSVTNVASYSVVLSNAAGSLASSNATLTIVPSKPVIVVQPTNLSVVPGAPASFSVAVVGNTPYSYQWLLNGTNLVNNSSFSGVTSNTLTVNSVLPADAGAYSVVVSNTLGTATSTNAVLSVIPVTVPGLAMSPLWSFNDISSGETPYSPLTQGLDGNFYGTTLEGGVDGDGTVFKVTTNGVLVTLLPFDYTDGALPYGGLAFSSGFFYGTTEAGGIHGDGTLFRMTATGGITTLSTFNGDNGNYPIAGMTPGSDGNFYGTTLEGGDYGYGTIFRMTAAGALATLVSFNYTDGGFPSCVLVQGSDGNFYGTTEDGGTEGAGTVFKITTSGIFTTLHSFTGANDGAIPIPGLIQANDGNFYGTTYLGAGGFGTVFEITSSGALTTRYTFTGGVDGGSPWGGLVQAADGNLYGTTQDEGTYGFGTVFQIAPTGTLATIAQFDGYLGANPGAALIQGKDGNLYGTTEAGGLDNEGAIYRLSISGPLQITGQPADQSVYNGGTALFSVATFGAAPVFYQWQQDGINLTNGGNFSGANSATLTISNATANDAALYSVVVSNALNSVASDDSVLEVIFSPPNITTQPASQTLVAGTTAIFTVSALGDQPLSFQWQENGTNLANGGAISGAATSSLTISGVTLANAGIYSVIVSNAIFAVPSKSAVLTVLPAALPGAAMTLLHLFAGTTADGAFPYAGLIQGKDGNLYGTAESGGTDFEGTVFRSTLAGTLSTLYSFTDGNDGANPYGSLVQGTSGLFYGTTSAGGSNGYGTTFRINANGADMTPLYSFEDSIDGAEPLAGLGQGADGNFYGTAFEGGSYSDGSVFKMTTTGVVSALYGFTGGNDGGHPYLAGVIQARDGKLYGTTEEFGAYDNGTVFSMTTNGTLNTLVSFDSIDGGFPEAGVIQGADGNFYGTTDEGGSYGFGTVFRVTTSGALTTLFSFDSTNGSFPAAALAQGTDGNLYGTTSSGGAGGWGTAFRITTNGALTTLLWFDGLNGADPQSAMVQASDGNFYGTTVQGGTAFNPTTGGGNGVIFRLTVPIFISNTVTTASAIAGLPYSSSISTFAIAPAGDALTFARVSGPAWLNVATNGALSGAAPPSSIGTNLFVVSLTDSNGVTAPANLVISVIPDPPPSFIFNPFAESWAYVDEAYSAAIATNATDPEIGQGDILTFGKISGPSWLNVAANGILSGTPEDLNAGSNTFVVSVTNLGGASSTATLSIIVDGGPSFTPQDFTKPAATAGLAYSGTIAGNATDPDLAIGDTLTFYMVTGPDWLTVADNGALSGTPSSLNLGVNNFLVLAVDAGELSAIGTMSIMVNPANPPVFLANPFAEPPVAAGNAYAATIATNASDPNFGAVLTFSKFSGPPWLNVAANGGLSGTPVSTNAGNNFFIVEVADATGLSSYAVMSINVTPAAPIVARISPQGASLMLSWTGGIPPYQVMITTNLNPSAWQNIGGPINTNKMTVVPDRAGAFYQIQGR